MTRDHAARLGLRAVAVAIAIAAAIDPAVTSRRVSKPEVAVLAADSVRDGDLAGRVEKTLAKRFTVVRTPLAGASAIVMVGNRVPVAADAPVPVFIVGADSTVPRIELTSVDVPPAAGLDSRVLLTAAIHAARARGQKLELSLHAGGAVVDRITRSIASDDESIRVRLGFVPAAAGMAPLRVTASVAGMTGEASADASVDIRDTRWAVLFFDPRPSWMSTFVRRAIERDPRFVVTSRVVTSRHVSTDAGTPPATLDDVAALSLFDAVVVGAPDALSDRDAAGLESFMRRRGGGMALLLDQNTPGAYERLTGPVAWASLASNDTISLVAGGADSSSLFATEIAWPATLPAGGESIVRGGRPVLWRTAVGAGELLVSGALDAWRYRDRQPPSFERFWQARVADLAASAPPPIALSLDRQIVSPGEEIGARVVVRDVALQPVTIFAANGRVARASLAAVVEPAGPVRLWPTGEPGELSGRFRAPMEPGVHRLAVSAEGGRAEASFIVARDVRGAQPTPDALLRAWASARGGAVINAANLGRLPDELARAVRVSTRLENWHPMRSAWWIVPFTVALAAEWWMRRRRGAK